MGSQFPDGAGGQHGIGGLGWRLRQHPGALLIHLEGPFPPDIGLIHLAIDPLQPGDEVPGIGPLGAELVAGMAAGAVMQDGRPFALHKGLPLRYGLLAGVFIEHATDEAIAAQVAQLSLEHAIPPSWPVFPIFSVISQ